MNEAQKEAGRAGPGQWPGLGRLADKPLVRRAGQLLLRFVLGVLLSQATAFGSYAPFGVGFVAAVGLGAPGFLGLLGALGGYMFLWDLSNSLKYIAVSVLVFAAGFVFQGTGMSKRPLFMPLAALTASAFVGTVFLAADGFDLTKTLLFISELILTVGSAYFFQIALRRVGLPEDAGQSPPLGLRRLVSLLLLCSCVLLSLSPVTLFGALSPARFLALLMVMLMAYRGGVGAGSAAGLALGAALDLAAGAPAGGMTFGMTGLVGGAFQGAGKLACACVSVLTTAAMSLWNGTPETRLYIMLEAFLASMLFMLIPDTALSFLSATPSQRTMEDTSQARLRDHVKYRLKSSASAFRALHESLSAAFGGPSADDEDIAVVLDRTAERVCKRCALVGLCWDKESAATLRALSDAAAVMLTRGALESVDFPAHFSARCLNFNRFVGVSNEELTALLYRRQYKNRLKQSRALVCRQYAEMSHILDGLAEDAARTLSFNWAAEEKAGRYLKAAGVEGRVSVTEDGRRVRVDILGDNLSKLMGQRKKTVRDLSTLLGVRLTQPEQERDASGERFIFAEADPLTAKLGIASNNKQGETVSGDNGAWFKTVDGRLVVLLSDGMGSGPEAADESGMAVRLLERFLRAGVRPETALATLNSALVLKSEEKLGFVTVDLLIVNLQSGESVFYKYGAAPSYIKRGRKVSRVTGVTLPAGLAPMSGEPAPMLDVTRLHLGHGETVLLVSDGVADAQNDKWLEKELSQWNGGEPKELAGRILEAGLREKGRGDDMTVMAVCVDKRAAARGEKATAG